MYCVTYIKSDYMKLFDEIISRDNFFHTWQTAVYTISLISGIVCQQVVIGNDIEKITVYWHLKISPVMNRTVGRPIRLKVSGLLYAVLEFLTKVLF